MARLEGRTDILENAALTVAVSQAPWPLVAVLAIAKLI
jgi:hypothetical protein